MRFLVIDDHPVVREVLTAVLRKAFGQVEAHAVGDLASALQWTREHGAPDMALLDLGLPGCSGIEALASLRHAHPGILVVIFSAAEDSELIRAGDDVKLTERQLDVLRLMLNGLSNAEIARALRISESTVKQHVGDVYVALRVSTRAQAMAAAARLAIKPAR